MPGKKKKHPEAEALFKGSEVPSLADQAKSDREADTQAVHDKTAKLKSLRLAKEEADRESASARSIPVSKLNASNDT